MGAKPNIVRFRIKSGHFEKVEKILNYLVRVLLPGRSNLK